MRTSFHKIDLEIICVYTIDTMPSPTYEQNKKHILKWIANNREKHNSYNSRAQKRRLLWRKESKVYLAILL